MRASARSFFTAGAFRVSWVAMERAFPSPTDTTIPCATDACPYSRAKLSRSACELKTGTKRRRLRPKEKRASSGGRAIDRKRLQPYANLWEQGWVSERGWEWECLRGGPPGRVQRDDQRKGPAAVALMLSARRPAAAGARPVRLDDLARRHASTEERPCAAVAHVEEAGA